MKIKFLLRAGKINTGAPLAPALRGTGINIDKLKKEIDGLLEGFPKGARVEISFDPSTNELEISSIPISTKIFMKAGVPKGGGHKGKGKLGEISGEEFNEILSEHFPESLFLPGESAKNILLNNCKDLGISIRW